jgi:Domain of unknown function (DUF4136)
MHAAPASPTAALRAPRPRSGVARTAVLVAVAGAALLAGCASQPQAMADGDRNAALGSYTTFTFARPLATEVNQEPSALTQHLEQAALREMRSRGFRQTSNQPQLIVNFNANTRQALPAVPTPPRLVSAGYYGYRDGQYAVWPGYRDRNAAAPYPAGTINIDIVDAASKQLVWEAVVPGAIPSGPADTLKPAVDAAVKAAFAGYPKPATSAGM